MKRLVIILLGSICVLHGSRASAATLTVCASGCSYSDPQAAINAAAPGDTILLRAGQTFTGHLTLRAKGSSTSYITIRSDAAASSLPADGVRLVPAGRAGANTSLSALARLVGRGGAYKTTPLIRAEAGAHHYRIQFIDFDGAAHLGNETLVEVGDDQVTTRPHNIVFDRVYIHGHKYKGQKRGVGLNGAHVTIENSYISDIMAVSSDSQGIAGWNGPGPFTITNNHLEGAAENIMFGGADPAIADLVPSDITVRRNHITKPLSWKNAILATPSTPAASATTGGTLAAGTHYFKVVAVLDAGPEQALSLPSGERSVSVSSSGAVTLSWSGVTGADRYRVYRGTSAGGQSRYLETAGASTSFTYTGSSERSGTPPVKAHKWVVKNLIELKNAERVTVDGNVIENNWVGGQDGYAVMISPRNSSGRATWSRVRDITFTNNIIRHTSAVVEISGYDDANVSQQTRRVTFRNNLMYDIDPSKWGGAPKPFLFVNQPADAVFDHNTLFHTISSVVYADTKPVYGFVFTNNIQPHGKYGIMGAYQSPGNGTLGQYFPDARVQYNVFAGGSASNYPSPNSFPTMTQWNASFADIAGEDFRLLTTSVFFAAGSGGGIPGADIGAIEAAIGGTPPPTEPPPPPPPPTGNLAPVAEAGGPYSGVAGSAVAVSAAGSGDPDGTIVDYRWWWSDEIVIRASQVSASAVHGTRWVREASSSAAGGYVLRNPDRGEAKRTPAVASPADYVDIPFYAASGVKYHVWLRLRGDGDSTSNDSVHVQFTDSLNASGSPAFRIGTTSSMEVVLEEGRTGVISGWGWNDGHYGSLAEPISFASAGLKTLRLQQREDGAAIDQIVISAAAYFETRPGTVRSDATSISTTLGSTAGAAVTHAFARAGTYAVTLSVTDDDGATDSDATTVSVVSGDATPLPTPGAAEIVLWAQDFEPGALVGRWALVSDASSPGSIALENADRGDAKITTALASPSNYAEVTFNADAGVPYRLWLRMRAANDYYHNDALYVQFSGTVSDAGAPVYRIGTTSAIPVVLEEGTGAGLSGWGWNDGNYGGLAAPITFATSGPQTLRIQQREDGVRVDQIVISAGRYFSAAPGKTKNDTVVVPR